MPKLIPGSSIFDHKVTLSGIGLSPEPSLRELVYVHYLKYLDRDAADKLTAEYIHLMDEKFASEVATYRPLEIGYEIPLTVAEQGAVIVGSAYVLREGTDMVCITVDLRSKYVDPPSVIISTDAPPQLLLSAGERTLNLDVSKPRDSITFVDFPDKYTGWSVFALDGPGRYTLQVVLVSQG